MTILSAIEILEGDGMETFFQRDANGFFYLSVQAVIVDHGLSIELQAAAVIGIQEEGIDGVIRGFYIACVDDAGILFPGHSIERYRGGGPVAYGLPG